MTSGLRRAVLGTILLAGTLLRLEGLGRDSLWHDEGWTASLVRGSPGRLLHHLRRHDAHPPLYYLLLQAFSPLGDSEAALRLPSALAGIAAIPLLYRLVRRLYGPAPATLAALLLALSPAHVHFSQEARSYALLFLLCLASLNLLFDLRIAGGPLRGAAFAACSAAIMATHYMGAFFLLSEGLAVLLIRRARSGLLREFLVSSAGAVLLFLPWLPSFLSHVRDIAGAGFWIPPVTPARVQEALYELVGHVHFTSPADKLLTWIPFFATAAAALLGSPRREDAALLVLLAGPIAGEIAVSLVSSPVFYTRTFLYVLTPLFALSSAVLFRLPRLGHAVGCAVLTGLLLPGLIFSRRVPLKENWRDAAEILLRGTGPEDRIVVVPGYAGVGVEYYALRKGASRELDRMRPAGPGTLDRPGLPADRILGEFAGRKGDVWLVLRYGRDEAWFEALTTAGFERSSSWKSRGVEIHRYGRRQPPG